MNRPRPHRFAAPPPAWDGLLGRRDLLRVGAVGLASSLLPGACAAEHAGRATARSVIVLWMAGGVTHLDTFDPKPDAPAEIRGTLGAIATTLPGVRFSETMPCLARQAHRLAVVRSFSSGNDDHFLSQAFGLSGKRVSATQLTAEPNVGAVVAKVLGPRGGLPGYIAVPGTTRPGPPPTNLFTGGWLGREFAPFATGGRARNEDFTAGVSEAAEEDFTRQALDFAAGTGAGRLDDRRTLRERLDAGLRRLESAGAADALDRQYRGAFEMLLSPDVRRAFDLRAEPDAVRERYGRTKIGQRCLLARRLVEAGARFVMVDYGYDPDYGNLWDNHNAAVQKHPPICEMVKRPYHVAGTERACAALLDDLEARGRLDETLLLFLTEFGRTPKINKDGGRDHWGTAGSIFFAGGGVRGGRVVGGTDKIGAQPTGPRYSPADVAATVYTALGIDPETTLVDRLNRPLAILAEGKPIPGVL
jgi:uncharacterized protein (DUF1501 family)